MVRLLLALLAVLLLADTALAQDKVALVIGNSAYQHASKLPNPVNDAADLAVALEDVGFDVTLELDLDAQAMRRALQTFSGKAAGAEMAMVYYAGHGIEIDKQNYLIPVDAVLATDRDVTFEAVSLDLVTEAVNGARKLKMVLLDACRNNPFAAQMTMTEGSKRSVGRGLTPPEPGGGTLIAYSAKGGTVAQDGSGRNSPFAMALMQHIGEPGLDVQFLFRKVRDEVLTLTNQSQEPFVYGSLPGESVYLVPPVDDGGSAGGTTIITPRADKPSEAQLAWEAVKDTTSPAILEAYLAEYPDSLYSRFAKARLDELQASIDGNEPTPRSQTSDFPIPGNGDVFVVVQTFRQENVVVAEARVTQLQSQGFPVTLVYTDDYDNMTPGYVAAVLGPYSRSEAALVLTEAQTRIAGDAFIRVATRKSDGDRELVPLDSGYHVTGHQPGEELNVRSGPGTDYGIVGTIPHNGRGVTVGDCSSRSGYDYQWCEVSYRGASGYAYARYLADEQGRLPN